MKSAREESRSVHSDSPPFLLTVLMVAPPLGDRTGSGQPPPTGSQQRQTGSRSQTGKTVRTETAPPIINYIEYEYE